jgi:hypothetical protein
MIAEAASAGNPGSGDDVDAEGAAEDLLVLALLVAVGELDPDRRDQGKGQVVARSGRGDVP